MRFVLLGLIAVVGVGGVQAQDGAGGRCGELAKVALPHAVVERAAVASRAELTEMKLRGVETLPEFCRVQIVDRPSADSEIKTEVWLPVDGWNGRLRAMGNGGFAGAIYFGQMAETVRQGYATVGTDTGHEGGKGDFALGHPEKVKDFGWRAVHDMTVDAKALVRAFYGKAQEKAYFTSCSDGGREALMEAQRFPGDYDGILAGAPAYNWTALMAGAAEHAKWMAADGNYLPPEKVPALAKAVNAACDAKDGVKDGVVNDPRACGFDPRTIACKAGDGPDCLMKAQAETVRSIYRGTVNDAGKVMFPGLMPGAEDGREGWAKWISGHEVGSSMSFFSQSFFGNFVYSQPEWDVKEFDFDRGYKAAVAKTAADLNATETNIAPFFARGGKLILYHGWNDPAIPALMSVSYYDGVVAKVGAEKAANGVRLYMVPGMQHCAGGPGATEFGQFPGLSGEGFSNVFTALEQWVEKGTGPGVLTAAKREGEGEERRVVMTRPVCPYPQVAKYDGKGDETKAGSFACVAGGK